MEVSLKLNGMTGQTDRHQPGWQQPVQSGGGETYTVYGELRFVRLGPQVLLVGATIHSFRVGFPPQGNCTQKAPSVHSAHQQTGQDSRPRRPLGLSPRYLPSPTLRPCQNLHGSEPLCLHPKALSIQW